MPLSDEQRQRLETAAKERGLDPQKLIAAAEARAGEPVTDTTDPRAGKTAAPPATDKPLYMYHLPFVTVNEVRTIWLGLKPIAGGDEYAAKFAAAQTAGAAKPVEPTE
jgi:hypothetical protein